MKRETTSDKLAQVLKQKGYEHTKTTTGVHTWWFEGMAIAEHDSLAQSIYLADDWDIAQMHKRHAAAQETAQDESIVAIPDVLKQSRETIEHLEARVEKLQADNAAYEAILLQAGQDFEKLKAGIEKALTLLVTPDSYTSEAEAKNILSKLLATPAQAAPVADVTLSEDAIEYLSHIWLGDKAVNIFPIGAPFHSLVHLIRETGAFYEYRLHSDYDTYANRSAISARRGKLLGYICQNCQDKGITADGRCKKCYAYGARL